MRYLSTYVLPNHVFFAKRVHKIKEIDAKRRVPHDAMSLTKIIETINELRIIWKGGNFSIVSKIPTLPSKANHSMMRFEANHPVKFSLIIRDSIEMFQPFHIDEENSNAIENMIGHGRGLQKELR